MMNTITTRFKTLEQLLQEQSRGEETDEVKPIVFTDHTGRQAQSRVWGENDLTSVNRNAVGFEVYAAYPLEYRSYTTWSH